MGSTVGITILLRLAPIDANMLSRWGVARGKAALPFKYAIAAVKDSRLREVGQYDRGLEL